MKHTLKYYIVDCPDNANFKLSGISYKELGDYFPEYVVLEDIMLIHSAFASPKQIDVSTIFTGLYILV